MRFWKKNISADEFVVSETNAHSAWRITEGEEAGQIRVIDFDSLQTRMIAPQEGQELRPLGFMTRIWFTGSFTAETFLRIPPAG